MTRRALVALLACGLLPLAMPGPASADVFAPISLVSANAVAQADFARDADLSGDGRFVAFDGSFAGVTGVWRRDLLTGAVEQVAGGDAQLPSISQDGRYVSFTTNEGGELAERTNGLPDPPHTTGEAPSVYVRDMDAAPSQPAAFTLASAADGSDAPLRYQTSAPELEHFGAIAAGRTALSADGRRVAFVTTAVSNLPGGAAQEGGEGGEPRTPALQVAVRDLDTKRTQLVSARYDPATGGPKLDPAGHEEAVPTSADGFGAVYPGGGQRPPFPGQSFAGASISADGSTVAWLGQSVGEQAAVLANDRARVASYTEPLWRRIADAGSPTRRVTGGSDPLAPGCSGEPQLGEPPTLLDPCQGPFDTNPPKGGGAAGTWLGANGDYLPRLSADGYTVAFVAGAREIASGEEFRAAEASDDLYATDMRSGRTRVAALRRLTELAGGNANDTARVAPIYDLDVSPDGQQVAFTSQRTVFPLGSPAYVSLPAAEVGMVELFDIDLANNTLTRVTHGFGGEGDPSEAANGPAGLSGSPSFSADGSLLAFTSDAGNLVFGDGNAASDVFVVRRRTFGSQSPAQEISPAPVAPTLRPSWTIGLSAHSRRDGSVMLYVRLPGAGTLRAAAAAAVLERRSRGARRRGHATVAVHTVASAKRVASTSGLVVVTLRLAGRYGRLARPAGGLSARASVQFAAPAHGALRRTITVNFRRTLRAHGARGRAAEGRRGR